MRRAHTYPRLCAVGQAHWGDRCVQPLRASCTGYDVVMLWMHTMLRWVVSARGCVGMCCIRVRVLLLLLLLHHLLREVYVAVDAQSIPWLRH